MQRVMKESTNDSNPEQTFAFPKYTSKSMSSSKSISNSFFVLFFLFSDFKAASSTEVDTDSNTTHFWILHYFGISQDTLPVLTTTIP